MSYEQKDDYWVRIDLLGCRGSADNGVGGRSRRSRSLSLSRSKDDEGWVAERGECTMEAAEGSTGESRLA